MLPNNLTDAASQGGYVVLSLGQDSTRSSARHVPYAEYYRDHTGQMTTPVQMIQKVAQEESERESLLGSQ